MSVKPSSMRYQTRITNLVLYLILSVMAVVWLVPLVIIVLTALRSQGDLLGRGIFAWPESFQWANFARAWGIGNFSTYFRNSATLIVVKVPLGIILSSLAAYPLAKMDFRFRNTIFIFFLLGLAIPVHVILTPMLVMMKQVGIAGHLAALLPPYVV